MENQTLTDISNAVFEIDRLETAPDGKENFRRYNLALKLQSGLHLYRAIPTKAAEGEREPGNPEIKQLADVTFARAQRVLDRLSPHLDRSP